MTSCETDWNATGAMLSAIVTFCLFCVALWQLQKISTTSNADFIVRFNNSFFTPKTRLLVTLLSNSALAFKVLDITTQHGEKDRLPYLEIDLVVVEQLKNSGLIKIEKWRKGFSALEVDDLILGHLDDVGRFLHQKLVEIDNVYHAFNYYVDELLAEGTPLREMLDDVDNDKCYDYVRYLTKEFSVYEPPPLE